MGGFSGNLRHALCLGVSGGLSGCDDVLLGGSGGGVSDTLTRVAQGFVRPRTRLL